MDAAAASGGDGTEGAPYATLDEALAAGATSIFLAAGDYSVAAPLAMGTDVDIRGVCADRVRILASATLPALVVAPGARAALTGVTVSGPGPGLLAGGSMTLDRVMVAEVGGWGVAVNTGALVARRVVVRSVRPVASAGEGVGLAITDGAVARLTDVVVEDTRYIGAYADGNAVLEGERLVVERIGLGDTGLLGGGIAVSNGSRLLLRETLVTAVHGFGVVVQDSMATLEALLVADVIAPPADSACRGIEVRDATATLTRVEVHGTDGVGLSVFGAGTVTASDVVIRDVRVWADFAAGILLERGSLEVDRAMLLDTAYVGAYVRGGVLTARDLIVRRVAWAPSAGSALASTVGGRSTVTRFSFTDLLARGAGAVGTGSQLTLEDGEIRRVREGPDRDIGRAIDTSEGAQAVVRAVSIDDVVETAIVASGLTETGVLALDTQLELFDVRITGIRERACAATTCPTEAGGTGVASLYGASLIASRLMVTGAPLCGVQVAEHAELDVSEGSIEACAIGACVAIEDYDLRRVVGSTRFVDNERNVETRSVYVPPRSPSF